MKQRTEKRVTYFIVSVLCAIILATGWKTPVTVHATSATLTFSAEDKSVTVDETFYVVLILDSSASIGGFEGYVSYDASLAEFVTGGSYVNGGEGLLRIYDMDSTETATTKKYSLEFKAKKTGDCVFDTSDAPAVYGEDGEELSVSSNTLTVSISKSETLSSNNNLSKLLISPGELNQTYNNDITAYKAEIPNESDMLFLSAIPEDEDAIVTVEGNEDLKVGRNYVHVVVTAASGAKKDIQIEVNRLEEAAEEEEEETVKEEAGVTIATDEENKTVLSTIHRYQIAELKDDSLIPVGYEASSITIGSQPITAYITSSDLENEFVLLYLTNESGETDFYQYDRIEKTIQRFEQGNSYDAEDPLNEDNTSAVSSYVVIMAAMAGLIILLSIALAIVILKHKNEKDFD